MAIADQTVRARRTVTVDIDVHLSLPAKTFAVNDWGRQLAEADDQSWSQLDLEARERYRRLAEHVWNRIDEGAWVSLQESW